MAAAAASDTYAAGMWRMVVSDHRSQWNGMQEIVAAASSRYSRPPVVVPVGVLFDLSSKSLVYR